MTSPSPRIWWQPPRRAVDRPAHRQITFLEHFYDLVYVVLIAAIGLLGFTRLDTFPFLIAVVILLLAPVYFGFQVRVAVNQDDQGRTDNPAESVRSQF